MSFDTRVYFNAVPAEFASSLHTALRELGRSETVLIPVDWETKRCWYLLEKPTDEPNDSFNIEVAPLDSTQFEGTNYADDERTMLSKARYCALVSTRLSAGMTALMIVGAVAKATDGIVLDYQVAAFEPAFDADLDAHRGSRGPAGKPALAERGFYTAQLAWEVAKAASAYEERSKAKSIEPAAAPVAPPKKSISPTAIVVGILVIIWALYKLHKAGYF